MNRIAVIALALLPLAAAAQMYKWVDSKGVTHFSESPPPDANAKKVDVRPATGDAPAQAPGGTSSRLRLPEQSAKVSTKEQQAQDKVLSSAKYNNCAESQRRLALAQADAKAAPGDKSLARDLASWEKNVKKYCE